MIAASLKLDGGGEALGLLLDFRDQMIAASLKPDRLCRSAGAPGAFPRSDDRGLIEASASTSITCGYTGISAIR